MVYLKILERVSWILKNMVFIQNFNITKGSIIPLTLQKEKKKEINKKKRLI